MNSPERSPVLVRRGRGIGTRLALMAAVLVLLTMAAAGGLLIRGMGQVYHAEARTRAASLLGTLAVPCAMAVSVNALERLDAYLSEVARAGGEHMDILHVAMLDAEGHVIAQATAEENTSARDARGPYDLDDGFTVKAAASSDSLWRETRDAAGHLRLMVSMPAVSGLRWGTLVATFDLRPVEARVRFARCFLVGLSVLFALVLGAAIYGGLSRMVVTPVRRLAAAAASIQRGNLGARADLVQNDELGRLADAFNGMAAEMQSYTEGLERKVAERSAEVQRKNEQLETVNQQLEQAVSELARLASQDALTGIANRRQFMEVIAGQVDTPDPDQTTLLMVDVDHFKRLNDTFGHPVGDVVLREVARLLGTGLRASDMLARYGGEEFTAVLPHTGLEVGLEVAERVRNAIAQHDFAQTAGQDIGMVSVSIGVASSPSHGASSSALIRSADQALYTAKHGGRNRVAAFVAAAAA